MYNTDIFKNDYYADILNKFKLKSQLVMELINCRFVINYIKKSSKN